MTNLYNIRLEDKAGQLRQLLHRLIRNGVVVDNTISVVCNPDTPNSMALRGITVTDEDELTRYLLNHFGYSFQQVELEETDLELSASKITQFLAGTGIITTAFSTSDQLNQTVITVHIDPLQVSLNNLDSVINILNGLYYEYPKEYDKFLQEDDYDNNQIPHPDYQRCLKRFISLRIKHGIPTGSLFKLMSDNYDVRFRTFIIGDCGNERVIHLVPNRKADFDHAWSALNHATTHTEKFSNGNLIVEEGLLLKALVPDKQDGIGEIEGLSSLLGGWGYNIKAIIPLSSEAGGQTLYYTTSRVIP